MPKQNKSTRNKRPKSQNPRAQNIGTQLGDQAAVGGDVTGGDKITAGGHVIQAEAGANVFVGGEPSLLIASLHQIPPPPADFTGREAELSELRAAIQQGGVIISGVRMHGLGGVGKTALALKLAEELRTSYPDAQFYLDLQGVSEKPIPPAEALSRIIHAFQPEAKLPESVAELRPIYLSLLHGKRALLLMDNAKDAAQVTPLLPPPACLLLVTSRQHFHLPGLHAQSLDALTPEAARELLVRIAPRVDSPLPPSLSPKGRGGTSGDSPLPLGEGAGVREKSYADRIARLCGYLPFALRAAGSLLAVSEDLSPVEYAERLGDEQARLKLANATLEGTEITLEASFNLSYAALDPETARVFRGLAVFPADFDAAAEEVIGEDEGHQHLSELVRRSLVSYLPSPVGASSTGEGRVGATGRYRLHDLARAYADNKLTEAERYEAQYRHAAHFKNVLSAADDLYLKGGDSTLSGLALFNLKRVDIEAGQTWAAGVGQNGKLSNEAADLCSDYPDAGAYVLGLRHHPRERIHWLDAALEAARKLKDRSAEGRHLGNLGTAYFALGEARKAVEYCEQCLKLHREIGDRREEGTDLGNLGVAYAALGEPRKAIEYYEQALVIGREIGDRRGEGRHLGNLGLAYAALGEARKAIEYYEQRIAIAREIGDWIGEGNALGNLGMAYAALGEARKAIEYYEQHLAMAREIGDRRGEGNALGNLGTAYAALGEPRKAIEYYEQCLKLHREIGDRRGEGNALGNLGNAYVALGEPRRAIAYYEQALVIDREIGDRRGEGDTLWNMSLTLDKLGERKKAIAHAEAALKIREEIEDPRAEKVRRQLAEWKGG